MNNIINFSKKTFNFVLRNIVATLQNIKKDRIILVQESFSGSNTYALYKLLSEQFRSKYEVLLYKDTLTNNYLEYIRKVFYLSSANIILTTHSSYKFKNKQLHIQLWHAMMIKKGGTMLLKASEKFTEPKTWKKTDFILSYSETYSTFLNAMMVTDPRKYKVFGAPRNDFLYQDNGYEILTKIKKLDNYKTKIIVCPTMRFEETNTRLNNNFLGLPIYDFFLNESNSVFYNDKNTLVVIKPHPHDEGIIQRSFINVPNNVLLLTDEMLESLDADFYEVLNVFDLLITDYSSVFFDFLLLNKPVLFYDQSNDELKQSRGLIVESVKNFLPGEVSDSLENLKENIISCLQGDNKLLNYEKRKNMLDIIHRYKDGKSTERIEDFLTSLLKS